LIKATHAKALLKIAIRDNARHDRALIAAAYRPTTMLLIISDLKFRPFKSKKASWLAERTGAATGTP
jgi:hypothetical protein